ncbi:MAG: hypothetical protein HQK53_05315 [Oligoflexia bacterium]|nr:hypothetical protein [Oligoflexia bacterium]
MNVTNVTNVVKRLLSSFVVLSSVSVTFMSLEFAEATTGPVYMCRNSDNSLFIRATPQIGRVEVIKADPQRPSYALSCLYNPGGRPMLSCTEEGGRGFLMFDNGAEGMSGVFLGWERKNTVSCIFVENRAE